MTSLFARLGHLEARSAATSLTTTSKWSARSDWVCLECRTTKPAYFRSSRVPRLARPYSDDKSGIVDSKKGFHRELRRSKVDEPSSRSGKLSVGLENGHDTFGPLGGEVDGVNEDHMAFGTAEDQARSEMWEEFEKLDSAQERYTEPGDAVSENLTRIMERSKRQRAWRGANAAVASEDSPTVSQESPLLDFDYASALPAAIEARDMDLVARCLFAAYKRGHNPEYSRFIRSIPVDTFSEILQILEPVNALRNFASTHVELSSAMTEQLGLMNLDAVADDYFNSLLFAVKLRRAKEVPLSLADYTLLLRSARQLGQKTLAQGLWKMMKTDGLWPDTTCWNHYMGAMISHGQHRVIGRHKVRVIPFFQVARQRDKLGSDFSNYAVGSKGIRRDTMSKLSKMLQDGAVADEETFRMVMLASAREGDVSAVKSILRSTWGIDVEALLDGQEEIMKLRELPPDSPLYPTTKLLFTLAHCFGINNNIPAAIRLVDFVARRYQLEIGQEVWSQLFEWTFVLAAPRTSAHAAQGSKTGQLPQQSVADLWRTMLNEPYNVKPTMGMYNLYIKNLKNQNRVLEMATMVDEGIVLYQESCAHADRLLSELESETSRLPDQDGTGSSSSVSLAALREKRRELEHAEIIRKRDEYWIRRWVRLYLGTTRAAVKFEGYYHGRAGAAWALEEFPKTLWRWRKFVPTNIIFETTGGTLEVPFQSTATVRAKQAREVARWERVNAVLEKVPLLVGDAWFRTQPNRPVEYFRPLGEGEDMLGEDEDMDDGLRSSGFN